MRPPLPRPCHPGRGRPPLPVLVARLTRLRLSLAVAAASLAGLLLHLPRPGWPAALLTACGVGLLAGAGSALNQLQERDIDALMHRTRRRPLPAGQLRPAGAALAAALAALTGLALLATLGSWPFALGLAALLGYNALYTPLKRRTPLALLPGALCGAVPPLIGWCAAGGRPDDFRILLIAALVFLWQLPHFWRIAEKNGADYRRAGLPLPAQRLAGAPLHLVRAAWTLGMGAVALLLPLFGLLQTLPGRALLLVLVLVLFAHALGQLRPRPHRVPERPLPAWPDLCLLLLLLLVLGEALLASPAPGLFARL